MLRPGERSAVDGNVVEGRSEIDQSLITGETLPKRRRPAVRLCRHAGEDRGVARARLGCLGGDAASRNLAPARKRAAIALPLSASGGAGFPALCAGRARRRAADVIGWLIAGASLHDSIITAIAVLIITCPCALGLAIPAVQTVASGALFGSGVLLNSGDAIERLAEVDHIIFDKTGTLTLPELDVANAAASRRCLALAGRVALSSRHPVAAAIARAAKATAPLAGLRGRAGPGGPWYIGRNGGQAWRPVLLWCRGCGKCDSGRDPEASVVAFRQGSSCHVFAVRQRLRADAAAVVAALASRVADRGGVRRQGAGSAGSGASLGICEWRAEVTPVDKVARINELARQGFKVLMVGDGLNDAPALAAAHASMSPISAPHMSQSVADAVFLGERLAGPAAIGFAQGTAPDAAEPLVCGDLQRARGAARHLRAGDAVDRGRGMSGSSLLVMANALRAQVASA